MRPRGAPASTRPKPLLGAIVSLAFLAAGCGLSTGSSAGGGGVAGTTITFSISIPDDEKLAVQELLSRFQNQTKTDVDLRVLSRFRSQPSTRVDLTTSLGSDGLAERLHADQKAGEPTIHLFAQDNLALKALVDEDLVQPLDEIEVPDAVDPTMRPPTFDGTQYFLPFRPNVRLTYVNHEELRRAGVEPPTTPEELEAAAQRLKAMAGRPRVTLSLAEGDSAAVVVSEWIVSFGGDPLVLNDEGSVRALSFLQRLWKEGVLTRESLFAKYDTEVEYLTTGVSALAQNWSFTAQLAKQEMLHRFRVHAGRGGPRRTAHVIGGDVLGIPKGVTGKQKEVAVALARYLMSKEAQELLASRNTWPSIRDDAYERVPPEQRETFGAIRQALRDGWFRPSVSY